MALSKVKQLRKAIENLSKWEKTGNTFGYIKSSRKAQTSYIYEFYCAMRMLDDLSKNHLITIEAGVKGFTFPKGPGTKKQYAKFLIKDKTDKTKVLFQCCLGTEITISYAPSTTFAADISFQTAKAPDEPNESHIVLVMDAKYKQTSSTKIDISIIREFAQCVSDMNVPKGAKSKLEFDKLKTLNANCLFTNGEADANHAQYCKKNKLKQIGQFDCDKKNMDIIG